MIKHSANTVGLDDYHEVLLTVREYNGTVWVRLRKFAEYAEDGGMANPGYDCNLSTAQTRLLKKILNENPAL